MEDRDARLALNWVVEPGDPQAARLVAEFGAEAVWRAVLHGSPERWAARAGSFSRSGVERLARLKNLRFVVPDDPEWPSSLSGLAAAETLAGRGGPPLGLWMRGPRSLADVAERSVAIVGSRAATAYGETVAADMGADVAAGGITVVSGGAYGVDSAAHRGALSVEGAATVAVLACGLDRFYPAGNSSLLDRIAASHLVVSEVPPGAHPTRVGFLARNRLIAALTQGTLLVEAAVRSGARNTASWATRLGRVLMAVPGSVLSAASVTPNRLIRDGEAVLVTSARDVLAELGPLVAGESQPPLGTLLVWDDLGPDEQGVMDAFPARASRTAAEISVASGVAYGDCLGLLGSLAEREFVEQTASGEWRLAVTRSVTDASAGSAIAPDDGARAPGAG